MSFGSIGRDSGEVEAIVVDRYLDSLLSRRPTDPDGVPADLRSAAGRLVEELPRFHPSFGFEERLARRLAEIALGLRLPLAAGAEGVVVPFGGADEPRQVWLATMILAGETSSTPWSGATSGIGRWSSAAC